MKRYITVEDALNAMCDNCDSVQAVCPHYPCKQYKSIEQLPSAQPDYDLSGHSDRLWKSAYERGKAEAEPRWIPVTERLPKEKQDVLLAYKHNMVVGFWENIMGEVTWYANNGDGWFSPAESVDNDGIPLAWMPLPEPFRKETEDG